MTLKLDKPITTWQENISDNKPRILPSFAISGPVWFVVKLSRKNVFGVVEQDLGNPHLSINRIGVGIDRKVYNN